MEAKQKEREREISIVEKNVGDTYLVKSLTQCF